VDQKSKEVTEDISWCKNIENLKIRLNATNPDDIVSQPNNFHQKSSPFHATLECAVHKNKKNICGK
jgi:hypothetical protein